MSQRQTVTCYKHVLWVGTRESGGQKASEGPWDGSGERWGGGGQEGHRSQEGGKGADLAVVQAKRGI